MSDQYQMTAVIRRINASQRTAAEAEGTVVTLGEGLLSRKSYYIVSTPRDGRGVARCKVEVQLDAPERKWMLPLEVWLTIEFGGHTESDARKLVGAIQGFDNPDKAIQSLVRSGIDDFLKNQKFTKGKFIDGFFSIRSDLAGHLVAALASISLAVTEIEVKIRGEDAVKPVIEVKIANATVVLQDFTPDAVLSLYADLALMPGSILPYIELDSEQLIATAIRRDLRDQFRIRLDVHAFQYSQEKVREVAFDVVKNVAESHGRSLTARFGVTRKPPVEEVKPVFEMKLSGLKFKQLDYPDPVEVDADFKLTLQNLGELVKSGVDRRHLDSWAELTLREAISQQLLDVTYVELFPQFEQKLTTTRTAFAAAARRIGYDVARFILQTNLDFHVLQRGFDCRIESAAFPLKLRECEVVLDIETELRITDKVQLQQLFSQNTAITQTITNTVRDTVARTLRDVSPEEFYLRFYGTEGTKDQSIAETLENAIAEACKRFKPEEGMKIHITRRPDALSDMFRALVQSEIREEVTDPNTGVTVDVKASVNSISVDHWHQFQERKPAIERVSESFRLHVLSFLSDCANRNLSTFKKTPDSIAREAAERWVNERLSEEYGVGVRINHWYTVDKSRGKPLISLEEQIDVYTDTIRDLTEKLSRAFREREDEQEIDDLKKRIAAVEELRDNLFHKRGPGSVLEPTDRKFQITAEAKQLGAGKSKSAASGESD